MKKDVLTTVSRGLALAILLITTPGWAQIKLTYYVEGASGSFGTSSDSVQLAANGTKDTPFQITLTQKGGIWQGDGLLNTATFNASPTSTPNTYNLNSALTRNMTATLTLSGTQSISESGFVQVAYDPINYTIPGWGNVTINGDMHTFVISPGKAAVFANLGGYKLTVTPESTAGAAYTGSQTSAQASLMGHFELTPVPEASTIFAGISAVGLVVLGIGMRSGRSSVIRIGA